MLAFVVRRLIGMVLVLFAASLVTFVIFVKMPGGDPALRMAGRTADPQNIANIRKDWGFDDAWYVQYGNMMRRTFVGPFTSNPDDDLTSYVNRTNVVDEIKAGLPATFSLAIGAGMIWLFLGIVVGTVSAVK